VCVTYTDVRDVIDDWDAYWAVETAWRSTSELYEEIISILCCQVVSVTSVFWLSSLSVLSAVGSRVDSTSLLSIITSHVVLCIMPSVLWRYWLGGRKGTRPVKNWVMVYWHGYLSGAAYAEVMPLPLTVSCFSKIEIGFTCLVPAHLGSSGQRAIKRVSIVCVLCVLSHHSNNTCNSSFHWHTNVFQNPWPNTVVVVYCSHIVSWLHIYISFCLAIYLLLQILEPAELSVRKFESFI